MADIPDEAVQAAFGVLTHKESYLGVVKDYDVRDMLEAALPYLPNPHDEFGCPPSDEENEHLQEAWARIRELEDAARKAIAPCGSPNHSIGRNLLKALLADDDRYPTSEEDADERRTPTAGHRPTAPRHQG